MNDQVSTTTLWRRREDGFYGAPFYGWSCRCGAKSRAKWDSSATALYYGQKHRCPVSPAKPGARAKTRPVVYIDQGVTGGFRVIQDTGKRAPQGKVLSVMHDAIGIVCPHCDVELATVRHRGSLSGAYIETTLDCVETSDG